MSYKSLLTKIDELRQVVAEWSELSKSPSQSERDALLDHLKEIYAELRFPTEQVAEEVQVEEPVVEEEPVIEEQEEELIGVMELASEPIDLNPVVESELITAPTSKSEIHKRILSLYDDSDAEPQPEQSTEQPAEEEQEEEQEEETNERGAIIDMLSINDRILIANDLCGGDGVALRNSLAMLDRQRTFDDAMICIARNFGWRGDSDGARLLATLLKNHFSV